jgi:hypothetical protein
MTTSTKLEWADLWTAMDAAPTEWIETTEDMYWNMLEALPVRAQRRGSFLVGEPKSHNDKGQAVYACFRNMVGDIYHAKHMTLAEFQKEFF